jgi:hypothetical protein
MVLTCTVQIERQVVQRLPKLDTKYKVPPMLSEPVAYGCLVVYAQGGYLLHLQLVTRTLHGMLCILPLPFGNALHPSYPSNLEFNKYFTDEHELVVFVKLNAIGTAAE